MGNRMYIIVYNEKMKKKMCFYKWFKNNNFFKKWKKDRKKIF